MLDKIVEYVPLLLAVVGAASVLVHALEPLVKAPVLGKVARFLEKVQALLGRVALNPAPKK